MELILAAALVAVIAAHAWLIDRKDKRHAAQVDRLLQRIQAPEQAVAEHSSVRADGPLYLPPEDDDAWNELHRPVRD